MNESSRHGPSLDDARTALLGPVRRTRRPAAQDPHVAELGVCRVCGDLISRSDDPWDNGWRCMDGCGHCRTMIGCVPTSGSELI